MVQSGGARKNAVLFNPDGFIEIHVVGDQTHDTVMAMGRQAERLLAELQRSGKPRLILDDITRMGVTDTTVRKAVARLARSLPYEKVAMLGTPSPLMRVGTRLLLQAIGMGRKIRYFDDRAAALHWLKGS